MRNFILGLAVGAAAIYVASKLIDSDKREELYSDLEDAADEAKKKFKKGLKKSRRKALLMSLIAQKEVRSQKKKLNRAAGDLADKLSGELADIEAKVDDLASEIKR